MRLSGPAGGLARSAPAALLFLLSLWAAFMAPTVVRAEGNDGVATPGVQDREDPDLRPFCGVPAGSELLIVLRAGGQLRGRYEGVALETGDLVLRVDGQEQRVSIRLVSQASIVRASSGPPAAMTTEGPDGCGIVRPAGLKDPGRYAWRPTWRSHLGVLLSIVAPGAGQFIQTHEQASGFVFLATEAFLLTSSMLAFFGPSNMSESQNRSFGIVFLVSTAVVATISSGTAWKLGLEWSPARPQRP